MITDSEAEKADRQANAGIALVFSLVLHLAIVPWGFIALNHFYADAWWIVAANCTLAAVSLASVGVVAGLLYEHLTKADEKRKRTDQK
jgi:hypothetical protein